MKTFEHNATTNEIIERNLTKEELAQNKIDVAEYEARIAEAEAKSATKQAILDRIGLTADELQTILANEGLVI